MNRPKGTQDIFGDKQILRNYIYKILKIISKIHNFQEIETPMFERKEVFIKSIGGSSDIVNKEMYSFKDKKNREMVLKPEGTSAVIRAIVENKLFSKKLPLKYFYIMPNFRYERPQKGRQRQFTQFGIEMFSEPNPIYDVETILFAKQILDSLNIKYDLIINSLGTREIRENYSKELKKYFEKYKQDLSKDSIERLKTNPLRILDDKIDGKKDFVLKAPKINDFYDKKTKLYFKKVTNFLIQMDIDFKVNPNLVRGLDYYSDTCFEFISISEKNGSSSTLIGGGRYSNLMKQFNGPDLSGMGFGLGIERIINEINKEQILEKEKDNLDIYVMNISEKNVNLIAGIVYLLRKSGYSTDWNVKKQNINKAFKNADDSNARIKIIAGDNELSKQFLIIKKGKDQEKIKINNLLDYLKEEFKDEKN